MSIAMVLTKLTLPLGLRLACLLDILYINEVINAFIHLYVSTLLPWMSHLLKIILFLPVSLLQGENVSEESNYILPLKSSYPTMVTLPDPSPHSTVLPTNQVPWKTYYKKNLKTKVESPIVQTAPV